jgi:hypothetical protein
MTPGRYRATVTGRRVAADRPEPLSPAPAAEPATQAKEATKLAAQPREAAKPVRREEDARAVRRAHEDSLYYETHV